MATSKKTPKPKPGWHYTISIHKSTDPTTVFSKDLTPGEMADFGADFCEYAEECDLDGLTKFTELLSEAAVIKPQEKDMTVTVTIPVKGVGRAQRESIAEKLIVDTIPGACVETIEEAYRW